MPVRGAGIFFRPRGRATDGHFAAFSAHAHGGIAAWTDCHWLMGSSVNYLLNSPVLTGFGTYRLSRCDGDRLRAFASAPFQSAVGHAGAAELLSRVLGVPVPRDRRQVVMQPGDAALVLRLLQRLPEGQVLDGNELAAWPHEFAWMECLAPPSLAPRHASSGARA